ncbi:uncharacterized protein EI90DRAFT_3014871 [Cantharellus anzutake]|uniref:uncharacterized protein n=1 Tax=Cantharellus anzutake TaxID=1750568 RepID=UPI001903843D|nr:uncharacterized protein EI90DRAFT_3014871 [Cantharellus anzutake]KAF8334583.1 hypothetical protein EI90DRAFT_3014871 [Cantharellus anzutake]
MARQPKCWDGVEESNDRAVPMAGQFQQQDGQRVAVANKQEMAMSEWAHNLPPLLKAPRHNVLGSSRARGMAMAMMINPILLHRKSPGSSLGDSLEMGKCQAQALSGHSGGGDDRAVVPKQWTVTIAGMWAVEIAKEQRKHNIQRVVVSNEQRS